MQVTPNVWKGLTIALAGCIWLGFCLATWRTGSGGITQLMVYGWRVTIFALPLLFAYVGTLLLKPTSSQHAFSPHTQWLWSLLSIACALLAYAMCIGVLERISAVWWEHVKFGGNAISLGKTAAEYFAFVACVVGASALALRKFAAIGLVDIFSRAALSLVAAASLLYFALGISPYAEWRA